MTLLQTIQSWAKNTFHLNAPVVELESSIDPMAEVDLSIRRGNRTRQEFLEELALHEKADVANALLRARDRATVP